MSTKVNTTIEQSAGQRNQRIATKSLYSTLVIAAGIELYSLSYEQYMPLLIWEKIVIFATSFLLIFAFIWLTGKRNIQIKIANKGVEISHDEEIVRFSWQDVEHWQPPAFVIQPYWLFELKNTQRIKIFTRCFSRKQLRQIRDAVASATRVNRLYP